jgi:peptide deformylase
MAKRKVVKIGDALLRKISKPVKDFDDDLIELLEDMKETMYENDGMGLAAPQVGVLRRVVVMEVNGAYFEFINPEIIKTEGEDIDTEGCLSVGKFNSKVKRPYKLTVRAYDRYGYPFEITGEKYFARCVCHEVDHLNGILFVDICEDKDKYKKLEG